MTYCAKQIEILNMFKIENFQNCIENRIKLISWNESKFLVNSGVTTFSNEMLILKTDDHAMNQAEMIIKIKWSRNM